MSLAGAPDEFDSPNARDRDANRPASRRLAIAAGGTGGHITAGLAIAEAYREAFAEVSVCFIGTACGLERRLVPSAGYPLELVTGTPVAGNPCRARPGRSGTWPWAPRRRAACSAAAAPNW